MLCNIEAKTVGVKAKKWLMRDVAWLPWQLLDKIKVAHSFFQSG